MTMTTAKKTLIPLGGKVGKTNALIRVTCKEKITSSRVLVSIANIFLKEANLYFFFFGGF